MRTLLPLALVLCSCTPSYGPMTETCEEIPMSESAAVLRLPEFASKLLKDVTAEACDVYDQCHAVVPETFVTLNESVALVECEDGIDHVVFSF